MLTLYRLDEAHHTLLKRSSLNEVVLPTALQMNLNEMFGRQITPAEAVSEILSDVRNRGDTALFEWTERLDLHAPENLNISQQQIEKAHDRLPDDQRAALQVAIERITEFHRSQPLSSWITQSLGGTLGQLIRPIRRVGLYIPGGSAPLPSSVLMSAIPARIAGVRDIVLVTPPQRGTGEVSDIILAVAKMLEITEIYSIGGSQAIAALAYGTETIERVDKIYGPGNIFVTLAKRQLFGEVGIDNLAGPTETVVIADDTANPAWVAADLLAQAEHDPMAAAILLTPSKDIYYMVCDEIRSQMEHRKRKEIISEALNNRSGAVITRDINEAIELANDYAPEHLCLSVSDPWEWIEKIDCAGGIFLGEHSCEAMGDYVAGPSHVMPTGGSARFSSPLNVLDFIHIISLIALDADTVGKIGPAAKVIADAELLDAHANAAEVRL